MITNIFFLKKSQLNFTYDRFDVFLEYSQQNEQVFLNLTWIRDFQPCSNFSY